MSASRRRLALRRSTREPRPGVVFPGRPPRGPPLMAPSPARRPKDASRPSRRTIPRRVNGAGLADRATFTRRDAGTADATSSATRHRYVDASHGRLGPRCAHEREIVRRLVRFRPRSRAIVGPAVEPELAAWPARPRATRFARPGRRATARRSDADESRGRPRRRGGHEPRLACARTPRVTTRGNVDLRNGDRRAARGRDLSRSTGRIA